MEAKPTPSLSKTLWLHPEANCNAFEHKIDDADCACEICKDKPRLIIVVN